MSKQFKELKKSLQESAKKDLEDTRDISPSIVAILQKHVEQVSAAFQSTIPNVLQGLEHELNKFGYSLGDVDLETPFDDEGSEDFAIIEYATKDLVTDAYFELSWEKVSGQQFAMRPDGGKLMYSVDAQLVIVSDEDELEVFGESVHPDSKGHEHEMSKMTDSQLRANLKKHRNTDEHKFNATVSEVERRGLKEDVSKEQKDPKKEAQNHKRNIARQVDKAIQNKLKPGLQKEDVEQLDESSYGHKVGDTVHFAVSGKTSKDHKLTKRNDNKNIERWETHRGAFYYPGDHKKKTNESVEQIDEISKQALGSYIKKATDDSRNSAFKDGEATGKTGSTNSSIKDFLKSRKRADGVKKATDKLVNEDQEQLDEISKKTLGSYIKKATDDVAYNSRVTSRTKDSRDRADHDHAVDKRKNGISKATNKLVNEDILEESLIKKASGRTITFKSEHGSFKMELGADGSLLINVEDTDAGETASFSVQKQKAESFLSGIMEFYMTKTK